MNRLRRLFDLHHGQQKKFLSIFITAGYPELDSTAKLVRILEGAGADFLEIGMPFSDPMADGPTIQRASQRALENGMTLTLLLEQVRVIREHSSIPILVMSYFNPIMQFGLNDFINEAERAGVDGLIIPDLIPEEYGNLPEPFKESSIGQNFLISPNTEPSRILKVDELTSNFIYCVAMTGVTGARRGIHSETVPFLNSLKDRVKHPYLVGFGISKPEDVRTLIQFCDGVIVGSALINVIDSFQKENERLDALKKFITQLKRVM